MDFLMRETSCSDQKLHPVKNLVVCSEKADEFYKSGWANTIIRWRHPQTFAEQGRCRDCSNIVIPLVIDTAKNTKTNYGLIRILPMVCQQCISKESNKADALERQQIYQRNRDKCCKFQNRVQKHQGDVPAWKYIKTKSGAQKQFLSYIMDVMDEKTSKGAYIYGNPGTGKTFLTKALHNTFIEDMRNTTYLRAVDLAMILRKECSGPFYRQILDEFMKVPYLFVDDYGTQKDTEWVMETMFAIIDYRYTEGKTTIITSNYPLEEYMEKNPRLYSRLRDRKFMEMYNFNGVDLRGGDAPVGSVHDIAL